MASASATGTVDTSQRPKVVDKQTLAESKFLRFVDIKVGSWGSSMHHMYISWKCSRWHLLRACAMLTEPMLLVHMCDMHSM